MWCHGTGGGVASAGSGGPVDGVWLDLRLCRDVCYPGERSALAQIKGDLLSVLRAVDREAGRLRAAVGRCGDMRAMHCGLAGVPQLSF